VIEFFKFSSFSKNFTLLFQGQLFKIFGLVFILVFILVIYAYSQEGVKRGSAQGRKTILDFKDELKLNEEQVKSIKKIIDEFEVKNEGLFQKVSVLDKELKELLEKEGELSEIRKKIREIFSLRAEMIFNEIEAGRKIDKVLNKEQKERWKQIRRGNIKKEGG